MKRQLLLTIILAAIGVGAVVFVVSFLPFFQPIPCGKADLNDHPNSFNKIIHPIYEKSWKVSKDKGYVDWSPIDKTIFIIGTNVYCADGSLLFSIANDTHLDFFSNERFSPDGSKISYLYRGWLPNTGGTIYSPLSQLQVFHIANKTTESIDVAENINDYDWGKNDSVIFYTTGSNIISHDINSGTKSIILNATSRGRIGEIDVSQDGKWLLFTEFINTSPPSGCNDMFLQCFKVSLVIRRLTNASSNSEESMVIYQGERIGIGHPRWTPDGSAITFTTGPSFVVAGFPCDQIIAVTKDGKNNATLFPAENEMHGYHACYDYNLAFNSDQTLIAHSKELGYHPVEPDDFQPQNEGTYLTFTELCNQNECRAPTTTIPIVHG